MLPSPFFIIFFFSFFLVCSSENPCLPRSLQCPPFNNTSPPFPFSTSPGCGHPSFQLHCSPSSSSSSSITINNLTFSLLNFQPNTSSLTLSPHPSHSNSLSKCSYYSQFSAIPHKSINLTGSPFRISDSSCSRLSVVKPCPSYTLPNCTHCPWHCSLIKDPTRLIIGCGSTGESVSEQGCQSDVLGFLDKFLKFGIQIEWDEQSGDEYFSRCRDCRVNKNGVCGFKSSDPNKPFLCLVDGRSLHRRRVAALSAIFVVLCLVGFVGVGFLVVRSRKVTQNHQLEDPATLFLEQNRSVSLLPPVFTYEELEASTNRFDPVRKIGDGGFGSVYLGRLFDGRVVAVKHLHGGAAAAGGGAVGRAWSSKSFCNEILILSSIDHPNLVKLHGYCSDPRGLLLVYDYIPNGTLADHLHGGPTRKKGFGLSWSTRVDIALQVATAVEYLHFSVNPPVVHRDITTANVFVDDHMRVRVGDFGLSRLLVCPDPKLSGELFGGSGSGCVWTGPQGTPGYLDPDYHRSFRLTEKSDVYSFGVVLLELVTGMRAVDRRREKREVALADMVVAKIQLGMLEEVVDLTLVAEGEGVAESVAAVAELAFRCVAEDKDDRPDAREVVAELRRIWTRTRGVKGSNSVVPAAADS